MDNENQYKTNCELISNLVEKMQFAKDEHKESILVEPVLIYHTGSAFGVWRGGC